MANAQPSPPITRSTCATCHGPITHYPRRYDDVRPNTIAVNDDNRWAHDHVSDWLHHRHRAKPGDS